MLGCLPEQGQRQLGVDAANTESSDDNSDELQDGALFGQPIIWLNSGLSSQTLTIDYNNAKSIYLIGDEVHNYLINSTNFAASYCIEVTFQQKNDKVPSRLRVKAIPAFSNNFSQNTSTRFFRVNLNTESGNDFCQKNSREVVNGNLTTIAYTDSNYDGSTNGTDIPVVLKTDTVCPDCTNFLTSSKVTIYQYNSSQNWLERVDSSLISYESLTMRLDMNASSDNGQSSCTDSSCQAQGFNCCVEGQCVNEKGLKVSGIQADQAGFNLAELEKVNNPNWYKNYPQFYYTCLERNPGGEPDPDPGTDPTDPVGDAQTRLNELIADYECIEELKTNSESDPFHRNPINGSKTYSKCDISTSSATLYYQNVMKRMYLNCGCSEKNDLTKMVDICPAYNYTPTYQNDNQGNPTTTITSISCVSPPVNQTPLPFQDLEVLVNSKSAPHRFFDTANKEIVPGQTLPAGATGVQEGTEFRYLDDRYIFPNNGQFNMNSILGQMTVALDQARPAQIVDIEFDKQYIITTKSGFFQPCPTCAKDSWFNNFTAFPNANRGVGVQALGYTTRRDTYGTNTTLGNYEDTKFSRACYVPPTMLPFSHLENADAQTQRQNRLKTQAALYINGYQRDWYGFNRGALIGSFDGVTWFAVGKGRIVKSTSTKLYLAINAPFADLSSPTNHTVAVQEYDFAASAPRFDYDPTKQINDAFQNEAGSCQAYHECETDSHCITKLGWEYTCAEVTNLRTKWPSFNQTGAIENANLSRAGNIVEFLQQTELPPGTSSKKCVYRGAGSPCRVDSHNITDEGIRKSLTCAPNFYCAAVGSSTAFNSEVARFGRPLNELIESKNHIYGMDANILGRPKHYLVTSGGASLPAEVQNAIEASVVLADPNATGKVGVCRPGKLLPSYVNSDDTQNWEPSQQHQSPDTSFRTDFISQIASCNSALYTDLRYSSCPMLDETGNYINTQDNFLNDNFVVPNIATPQSKAFVTERYSFSQNSCGLESLAPGTMTGLGIDADDLKDKSAFKTIELNPLSSSSTIIEKGFARDACFRKAGAVCHTDLDCSPNREMARVVDLVPASYFGNAAEKTYFEEYLVCGQATKQPALGDANYFDYNLHNNRCCREIGNSITMFTEDSPNATESTGLQSHTFGSLNPSDPTRYSRYSVVDATVNSITKKSNIIRPSANTLDADNNKSLDRTVNITNSNQWKTVANAASRTCCGGNWVREFADGTNNWSRQRLQLNTADFKCINNRSPLSLTENAAAYNLNQAELEKDRADFCADPTQAEGGCTQQEVGPINDFRISLPILDTTTAEMILDTEKDVMDNLWLQNLWSFHRLIPYDAGEDVLRLDWTKKLQDAERKNLITRLPSFITFDTIADISIELTDPAAPTTRMACTPTATPSSYNCGNDSTAYHGLCGPKDDWNPAGACAAGCCFVYNPNNRSIRLSVPNADKNNAAYFEQEDLFMRIKFTAAGTLRWEQQKTAANAVGDASVIDHRRSAKPGNALYYLKKLAKLEYIGIPQMTYEPLYCNDNYQKMVPGIFKETAFGQKLETVMDFINHDRTFIDPGVSKPWASDSAPAPHNADSLNQNLVGTQELLDHPAVFSDNKFKCCQELGSDVGSLANASRCCSGFAVEDESSTSVTCKLPDNTNLNVYYNKFVSGEGLSPSPKGVAPLTEADFDPKTGEPLTETGVLNKLTALGEEHCQNGATRRGAIFGNFEAQPRGAIRETNAGEPIFSIVDDISVDSGTSNNVNVGGPQVQQGFMWNHHIYCDKKE